MTINISTRFNTRGGGHGFIFVGLILGLAALFGGGDLRSCKGEGEGEGEGD